MSVYVNNLTINIGTDFTQTYDLFQSGGKIIDLTNFSAASSLRKHKDSQNSVSFTVGFPDRKKGKIKISIPSWTTSNLKPGRYVYDAIITTPFNFTSKIIEGMALVREGVVLPV